MKLFVVVQHESQRLLEVHAIVLEGPQLTGDLVGVSRLDQQACLRALNEARDYVIPCFGVEIDRLVITAMPCRNVQGPDPVSGI